jgi:hypothetical protein
MYPIIITLAVVTPIIALGTWIYLRRRKLSSKSRIILMTIVFIFVLVSGPTMFVLWTRGGFTKQAVTTSAGGRRLPGHIILLWFCGACGTGADLVRLCLKKGEL